MKSTRVLQERCQQLRKLESTITKVNEEIYNLDCADLDRETYWMKLQELGDINRHLVIQRKNCREAIILRAMEVFGDE